MEKLDESQIDFESNDSSVMINSVSKAIKINQKCIKNNTIYQFCMNIKCQEKNNFVCNDDQCQCHQKHQFCQKGHVKSVLKKINQKLTTKTNQLKLQINKIFTDLQNKISEFQQILISQVDNDLKFIQLSDLEKNFYQIFVEEKIQNLSQFNGLKLQKLWRIIDKNSDHTKNLEFIFKDYVQKINKYSEKCLQNTQITKKQLKSQPQKSLCSNSTTNLSNLPHPVTKKPVQKPITELSALFGRDNVPINNSPIIINKPRPPQPPQSPQSPVEKPQLGKWQFTGLWGIK